MEPVALGVRVHPFPDATPFVIAARGASVEPTHVWHEAFELSLERERGLDHRDDHLHVATFLVTLKRGELVTIVASAEGKPDLDGGAAIRRRRSAEKGIIRRWRSARPKRESMRSNWGHRAPSSAARHQGTVWGWLLGAFALAHLRVHSDPATAASFLEPMARHLGAAGVGSLSEIFDGDPPFAPRGCVAQAWTVAEILRAWCDIDGLRSRVKRSALGSLRSTRSKERRS